VAVLGAESAILALIAGRIGRCVGRPSPALLLVGAAGMVPWCVYAFHMWRSNRAGAPVDVTNGIDHFAMQAALALAVAALPFLAAFEARMRPLVGTAGLAAAYLGAVSVAAPGAVGALSGTWAAAAIAGGAALLLVAVAERARPRPGSRRRLGPAARAVELTLERPAEHPLEPPGDADQRVQVDPRLDAVLG
jgi:hypothetical protein